MSYDKFNHLWSSVGGIGGTCTASKKELRGFLEQNGGDVMKNGWLHDVKSKHLGAGVYKVWLEPRPA